MCLKGTVFVDVVVYQNKKRGGNGAIQGLISKGDDLFSAVYLLKIEERSMDVIIEFIRIRDHASPWV